MPRICHILIGSFFLQSPFFAKNSKMSNAKSNPLLIDTEPQPEFLDVEESNPLLEKTMYKTGRAYAATAIAGGMVGFVEGVRYGEKTTLKLRINAILNSISKRSIKWANAVAVGLLMFQGVELAINMSTEDEVNAINTLGAGFLAGAIYKSTAFPTSKGFRKLGLIGLSGAAGALASGLYSSYENRYFYPDLKTRLKLEGLESIFTNKK